MQLSWQPGFSLSRKPVRRTIARRNKRGASGDSNGPRQFEFIAEQPVRKHGPRRSLPATTSTRSAAPVEPTTAFKARSDPNSTSLSVANCLEYKHSAVSNEHGAHSQVETVGETGSPVETPLWISSDIALVANDDSPDAKTIYGTTDLRAYPCGSEDECAAPIIDGQLSVIEGSDTGPESFYETSSRDTALELSPAAIVNLFQVSRSSSTSMPPSIIYTSLSQRFRPILDRCILILRLSASRH